MEKRGLKVENWILAIPFLGLVLFLFYANQTTTLMADDYRYSMLNCFNGILNYDRIKTFADAIRATYADYITHGSRIIPSLINMGLLTQGTAIFKILSPLVVAFSYFYAGYILLDKELFSMKGFFFGILCFSSLFFINIIVFDETIIWITGTVFYAWSMVAFLIFLHPFVKENYHFSSFKTIILLFFSVYAATIPENIAITLATIIGLILFFQCFIKKNKIFLNKTRLLMLIIFLIFLIVQIKSPGSSIRAHSNDYFLWETLILGFFNMIDRLFYLSTYLPILVLSLLLFIIRKWNKKLFYINTLFFVPLFVFILLNSLPHNFWIYQYESLCEFIMPLNFFEWKQGFYLGALFPLLYYGVIIGLIIFDVIFLLIKNHDQYLFGLFLMIAFPLLTLIPLGGAATRVAYPTSFFMIVTMGYIGVRYVKKIRWIYAIALFGMLIGLQNYRFLSHNIRVVHERERIIRDTQIEAESMGLPRLKNSTHGNYEDNYSVDNDAFRKYHGFPRIAVWWYDLEEK